MIAARNTSSNRSKCARFMALLEKRRTVHTSSQVLDIILGLASGVYSGGNTEYLYLYIYRP